MTEPPKLFTNKPKKAALLKNLLQLQQQQQQHFSSPSPPTTESFARRYKFIWPLLLAVNLGVGVYLFTRTKKKDTDDIENLELEDTLNPTPPTPTPIPTSVTAVVEISSSKPITEAPNPRERVPENQQRELFKWFLEEKRKMKPKNAEEEERLDEEKAILKQFIHAKSILNI